MKKLVQAISLLLMTLLSVNANATEKTPPKVCSYVLNLSNDGKLGNYLLKSDYNIEKRSDREKIQEISGKISSLINYYKNGWGNDYIVFAKNFDINNDGKKELVVNMPQGTAHVGHINIFDKKISKIVDIKRDKNVDWESDNLRWNHDYGFLLYDKNFYKIGVETSFTKGFNSVDYANYVSIINKNNVEHLVCEFGLTGEYKEEITKSVNDKVCNLANSNLLDYYVFDIAHNVKYEDIKNYGVRETDPQKYAGEIDIDNDGKKEMIIPVDLSSGSGRGCDLSFLMEFEKKDGSIKRDNLNSILAERSHPESSRCFGSKRSVFNYDNKNYLEIKFPKNNPMKIHQILKIENNKLEEICNFKVIPTSKIVPNSLIK